MKMFMMYIATVTRSFPRDARRVQRACFNVIVGLARRYTNDFLITVKMDRVGV